MIYLKLLLPLSVFLMLSCNGELPAQQQEQGALPGFYTEGRHLYDRNGEGVILRGITPQGTSAQRENLFTRFRFFRNRKELLSMEKLGRKRTSIITT